VGRLRSVRGAAGNDHLFSDDAATLIHQTSCGLPER